MNGRSLKLTPSPFRSPLCSGVQWSPDWKRQIPLMRKPQGSRVFPDSTITCVRAVFDGPHALSVAPTPPMSFGPNAPIVGFVKPSVAVQQVYDELSYAD